ncbi:MAG: hypothetical protein H0V46_06020 [Sphingomonas sp.]|nr:hypothetical protein [Sphingomonas sp.]
MVSNVFAKSGKNEKSKALAEAAMFFYLGRIAGRLTDAQLRAALLAQERALKGVNVAPIMAACSQNLRANVNKLQTLGRRPAARR